MSLISPVSIAGHENLPTVSIYPEDELDADDEIVSFEELVDDGLEGREDSPRT